MRTTQCTENATDLYRHCYSSGSTRRDVSSLSARATTHWKRSSTIWAPQTSLGIGAYDYQSLKFMFYPALLWRINSWYFIATGNYRNRPNANDEKMVLCIAPFISRKRRGEDYLNAIILLFNDREGVRLLEAYATETSTETKNEKPPITGRISYLDSRKVLIVVKGHVESD